MRNSSSTTLTGSLEPQCVNNCKEGTCNTIMSSAVLCLFNCIIFIAQVMTVRKVFITEFIKQITTFLSELLLYMLLLSLSSPGVDAGSGRVGAGAQSAANFFGVATHTFRGHSSLFRVLLGVI